MTHIPRETMSRLLAGRPSTMTLLVNPSGATQIPSRPVILSTRFCHGSASGQDKTRAPSPHSRPQQNKSRKSIFWQRRDRKETRNRISTLALDPSATTEADAQEAERESRQRQRSGSKDDTSSRDARDRLMSRDQRRILLFAVVLSMPIIGRDVMEYIVPGLLGTIIFVGSKIKGGIKWVRRIGSGEEI